VVISVKDVTYRNCCFRIRYSVHVYVSIDDFSSHAYMFLTGGIITVFTICVFNIWQMENYEDKYKISIRDNAYYYKMLDRLFYLHI